MSFNDLIKSNKPNNIISIALRTGTGYTSLTLPLLLKDQNWRTIHQMFWIPMISQLPPNLRRIYMAQLID